MGLPSSIGPPSPAFANTCDYGLHCENLVRDDFVRRGFILVAARLPLVFAEIDLVFLSPQDEIILVEVKSVRAREMIFLPPVKNKQKNRLRKALMRWSEAIDKTVRLHLAAVNHDGEIITFFDFLAG